MVCASYGEKGGVLSSGCDMIKKLTQVFRAASSEPASIEGVTLPDLLEISCQEFPNLSTFFQFEASEWRPCSNQDLKHQVDQAAVGLRQLGLNKGDRVGFLLNSDLHFLAADLACAKANLVSVPIDLSQTIDNIIFSLNHSEARAFIVVNHGLLSQVLPYLNQVEQLRWIIVCQPENDSAHPSSTMPSPEEQASSPPVDSTIHPIPPSIGLAFDVAETEMNCEPFCVPFNVLSWEDLLTQGQAHLTEVPESPSQLDAVRVAQDLATIIYTPDETGKLLGVMLSHENLTSTALASFGAMTGLRRGDRESVVTFLPLTHIFARVMLYGHLYYSHRVYFSTPRRVMKHLKEIQPTIFITVPLLLHRVYRRLNSYGEEQGAKSQRRRRLRQWAAVLPMHRVTLRVHHWAMAIAQRQGLGSRTFPLSTLEKTIVEPVFRQWRGIFGGRVRYCLAGGAALDRDVARFFLEIGFPVYQGYGLTQTSSTVTFNHPGRNFPGTVGQLREGVECAIAQDGEVLVKGSGNMLGYFKNPEATASVMDESGWFHTGDLGYLDAKQNLTLVGSKKNLFKLTTGKYVTPIPLEATLQDSPLVRHALVIGEEQKYCAALLFTEKDVLLQQAKKMGLVHFALDALLDNPCIQALYQSLIDEANCHFPYWSTIKKIRLLPASDYPTHFRSYPLSTVRNRLVQRFAPLIEQLYHESSEKRKLKSADTANCRDIPLVACPVAAQSLKTHVS